jgi:ATP/maltotriose-dependent transcriptional regulator MalT
VFTHRVAATVGCDDDLAAELERTAWEEVGAERLAMAEDHLLMASDLSSDPVSREHRLLAAVQVMYMAGDLVSAWASRDAVDACAPGPARSYVLGCLAIRAGSLDDAETHLQAAVAGGPQPYRGWALISLSGLGLLRGDPDEAVRLARLALEHTDGDARARVFANLALATGMGVGGQFKEGLAVLHAPDSTSAPPAFEANLLCEQGILRLWANDVSGAIEDLSAALRWSRSGRPVRDLPSLHGSLADAQYRAGVWDQAVINAELAVSLALDMDMVFGLPMAHAVSAYVYSGRGESDVANDHARRCREAAKAVGTPASVLFAALAEATLAQATGDTGVVLTALEACLVGPVRTYIDRMDVIHWRILYAEALLRRERFEEAEVAIATLEHLAERDDAPATRLHAFRLRGMLQGATGDLAAAKLAFDAARLLEADDLTFASALTDLAHGQLLRRSGQRRQAVTRLQDARGRFELMSAEPYVTICDEELVACGLRRDRGTTSPFALTPREESVARLVASGLSNSEAAADLYVSTKTIEYHLSNAFAKLNISSRRELAKALGASIDVAT